MESTNHQYVVPYQLCLQCKKYLHRNNSFNIAINNNGIWSRAGTHPSKRDSKDEFEHYRNVRSLFQSAGEGGCHLCSLLVDHIFAYYGDDQSEQIIQRLQTSKPRQLHALTYGLGYQPRKGCTRFQIHVWEDPVGEGEALSIVQVHQHLKSLDKVPEGCSSLLEKEHEWPEEAGYRWSTSTGSDAAFTLIKKWLNGCLSNHEDCNTRFKAMAPTRLLDVEGLGAEDIRLVDGPCTENKPYATLSYCWGPIKPIMLERHHYQDFRSRIPWERLPQTMKDAVTVCRKLSIRYLWIDALCIIQGSDGDFETEASRMESVYAGSLFTIAAADSEDSNGGCFQDRFPLMREDLRISEDEEQITFVQARPSCKFYGNLPGHCVLDTRGWVFQERILSPRTLYFGQRGLHMECRQGLVCEYNPEFHTDESQYRKVAPLKNVYSALKSLGNAEAQELSMKEFKPLWASILKGYTRTALSHPSDKLSALAGIASLTENSLGIEASFGLWLPLFPDELLWEVNPKPGSPSWHTNGFDFIPTWSWANVNASVESAQEETMTANKQEVLRALYSATLESAPPATPFIQIPVLETRFPHPAAVGLRGRLVRCFARPYQPEFGPMMYELNPEEEDLHADRKRCSFHPDLPMEEEVKGLYCFLVKREHRRKLVGEQQSESLWDFGLVLKPSDSNLSAFQRVGLYHEKMVDSMCNWPQQLGVMERVAQSDHDGLDVVERMELHMIMFPPNTPGVVIQIT